MLGHRGGRVHPFGTPDSGLEPIGRLLWAAPG